MKNRCPYCNRKLKKNKPRKACTSCAKKFKSQTDDIENELFDISQIESTELDTELI